MEIFELTALELGAALKKGEVALQDVLSQTQDRIYTCQEENNAFISITKPDLAPTIGDKILGDFIPPYNASIVEKLIAAGAISMGKLNMDEFAMGSTSETSFYGPVRNPWDLSRVSGGSSGGAAAAVAAGEVWYAIGSDTGGSIRQPAAYCGVTGMKPTAADCAAVLDIIQGKDPYDATSLSGCYGNLLSSLSGDVKGLRIGLPTDCFGEGLDPEVRQAVLDVAQVLKSRGAIVEEFSLPIMEYVVPAYYIIACAEASSNLSRFDGVKYGWRAENYEDLTDLYTKTRSEGFGSEVKRRILLGTFVLSTGYYDAYYKKALQVKSIIKTAYDDAFQKYDMLLTPVTPATAPQLGESLSDPLKMYLSDIYTVPLNLAGLPGISIPCGFDSNGMPIGAQLIGPALGDSVILNAAHSYQLETDFHKKTLHRKGGTSA